jgi:small glutamine-rich tetratricopeptide repeat-containing protein alpha
MVGISVLERDSNTGKVDSSVAESCLVNSFVDFLKQKKTAENEESLEIIIQCLGEVWKLNDSTTILPLLDIVSENLKVKVIVSKEQKEQAEEWKRKGNDALSGKRYEESIQCYTKAAELDPTCSVYPCNRAAAYSLMGKDSQAVEDCLLATRLDPAYCKAWTRLGLAYFQLQQYDSSISAYEKAKELEPNNVSIDQGLKAAQEKKQLASPSSSGDSMPDISKLLNDPNMMDMAKNLMSSGAINDLLKNPAISKMAASLFGKNGPPPS